MNIINLLIKILNRITTAIGYFYKYRSVFTWTGFVATRRFAPAKVRHKYAVLIAARNEETVIGNLIESIRKQDYPQELISIFVVADNCTDNTSNIARESGAICYERTDTLHRTKGYALQYLVECIRNDYGIQSFEGYFIFDADNLLASDYISRMNDSFDSGEKIITSYRNTKNFGDNWISASYGIHWLRTVRNEHRARSLYRLATRIQGTGFLFASEIIENGWNYTSLTEDRAFCADAVVNGYKISFNYDAVFYDEQPTDIRIAMRQRIRWAKGHLQAVKDSGGKLFTHIFVTKGAGSRHSNQEKLTLTKKIINNIRLRFMSFDMLTVVFPRGLITIMKRVIVYMLRLVSVLFFGKIFGIGIAPSMLKALFSVFGVTPKADNIFESLCLLTGFTIAVTLQSYIKTIFTAVYVFIIERKRIQKMAWHKTLWFCLAFPLFDIIGRLSFVIALFTRVEWKPIPHKANIKISDIPEANFRN